MKILYYYSKLNIGGAERSTVRMLNALAEHGDDVTLLLRWDGGALEHELNAKVKVIYLKKQPGKSRPSLLKGKIWTLLQFALGHVRLANLRKQKFDMAISGLFGYDPAPLLKNVKASCYAQMLRNDVLKTGAYGKTKEYMDRYGDKFLLYLGVSKYTTDTFRQAYPELASRAHTLYNFMADIDSGIVHPIPNEMANDTDKIKIVTIGRITDVAKGVFRMVDVCKVLSATHHNFKWYVVGEGPDKKELQKKISDAGLCQTMILCKGTTNPFPYYVYADLVAVLSYYEGLCGVVNEAKLMKRPVIATRFSAIDEQINDGVNGYIVENNTDAIIEKMQSLLEKPELISKTAINGMNPEILDNTKKIDKLHRLFQKITTA